MKTNVTKLDNSQVKIDVTLSSKELETYREPITKKAIANLEISGFRKGKVPQDTAMEHINPMKVLEEMAHTAISEKYIDIIKENNVSAIGHPQISINKIAEGSDLEFSIVTAVLPEVTIADYKKVAKKVNAEKNDVEVTEEEVTSAILNLRKMKVQQSQQQEGDESKVPTTWKDIDEKELPELTNEWVQEIGPFENIEDFTSKMRANLKTEKESKEVEKKRLSIIDGILGDSKVEVPPIMVDHEVDKMMHEFEGNIAMTGMTFDDYLSSIEKTRDDYKQQWQEQGLKRAQTQLLLNHIAKEEKIEPSDEEIQAEVEKIMEQYKNQPGIDKNAVLSYVATILTHQKVFQYLESIT